VAVERLGELIRRLPKEAVVYGRGWWQAPVVSFFAGRHFEDLDWMPRDRLEKSLDQHYFVIDRAFARLAREDLASVLARMEHEVIESAFEHSLLRVDRVYPYRPFPDHESVEDPKTLVDLVRDSYPHVRGLHDPSQGGRWARRFAGALLARDREGCLKLRLWFPDMDGYPGSRVRVSIEVNDRLVREAEVRARGDWEVMLPVPREASESGSVEEVEVGIDGWWKPAIGNFAQLGFLMEEVGFVDCPSALTVGPEAGLGPSGRQTWTTGE
jgi:hypothetical protein